jgi:L-fucose isomerase
LVFTWLAGGNPPLFMDFRKVWEQWELKELAHKLKMKLKGNSIWEVKGLVDGNNSGSASFDWAAMPGSSEADIMMNISFPLADKDYFPGGGNSVCFISPEGIEGIAGRLTYSSLSGMYSMVWDEAMTVLPPEPMVKEICQASSPTWPHTFVVPKHATMTEYKQYAPANHFHMIWNLKPARLQYWMDMTNVLSVTPWGAMSNFREGIDRPLPLLFLINGGETACKILRRKSA